MKFSSIKAATSQEEQQGDSKKVQKLLKSEKLGGYPMLKYLHIWSRAFRQC